MDKHPLRRLAIFALATFSALALTVGVAAATCTNYSLNYCGSLVASHHYCAGPSNHTYSSTDAHYPGAGTVYVCAYLFGANSGNLYASGCNNNYAVASYGSNCSLYFEPDVWNGDNSQHTINGKGNY
jgi:hypothetical protein